MHQGLTTPILEARLQETCPQLQVDANSPETPPAAPALTKKPTRAQLVKDLLHEQPTQHLAKSNTTLKKRQRATSSASSVEPASTNAPMGRRSTTTSPVHASTKPTRQSIAAILATTSGRKENGSAAPYVASNGTWTAKNGSSAQLASIESAKAQASRAHHHPSTFSNHKASRAHKPHRALQLSTRWRQPTKSGTPAQHLEGCTFAQNSTRESLKMPPTSLPRP